MKLETSEKALIKLVVCVALALTLTYIGLGEINNLMMYYGGGVEGLSEKIWVPPFNMTSLVAFEILWVSAGLGPWVMIIGFWLWRRSYWREEDVVELLESVMGD